MPIMNPSCDQRLRGRLTARIPGSECERVRFAIGKGDRCAKPCGSDAGHADPTAKVETPLPKSEPRRHNSLATATAAGQTSAQYGGSSPRAARSDQPPVCSQAPASGTTTSSVPFATGRRSRRSGYRFKEGSVRAAGTDISVRGRRRKGQVGMPCGQSLSPRQKDYHLRITVRLVCLSDRIG